MNIDLYTYSGIGGRPINEDSFGCGEGYYVVSDGLGGHDNGEVASSAAVGYISEHYCSDISAEAVGGLLTGADDTVRQLGGGGKATVAAVFTDGDRIRIANVGDSRVYYFRQGNLFFRTKDHSVCQASVDMGEMTDDDVRHSADRSGLLKVLGDEAPLKLPKPYDPIDPQDGDAFLICSDGFWEHVYDMEIQADLLKSQNAREWLEHMLKRQLLRAENKGDNFTAVCGIIHAPDKLPRTTALSDNITVDIPTTMELHDSPAAIFRDSPAAIFRDKKKLMICAAAAAAVVVAGIIAAVLIINHAKPDVDEGDSSDSSALDSSFTLPGLPGKPSDPNSPGEPSDPNSPGEPSDPNSPGESGDPNSPGEPSSSDVPGIPSEPSSSDVPGIPSVPDSSDVPGIPNVPDSSDVPGIPNVPDSSDVPGIPNVPDTSDVPGIPSGPSLPGKPNIPPVPEQPEL